MYACLAYQGIEKDGGTGWSMFELRSFDTRTARWSAPDPYMQHYSPYLAMGNNPVSGTDADGGWAEFSFNLGQFIQGAAALGSMVSISKPNPSKPGVWIQEGHGNAYGWRLKLNLKMDFNVNNGGILLVGTTEEQVELLGLVKGLVRPENRDNITMDENGYINSKNLTNGNMKKKGEDYNLSSLWVLNFDLEKTKRTVRVTVSDKQNVILKSKTGKEVVFNSQLKPTVMNLKLAGKLATNQLGHKTYFGTIGDRGLTLPDEEGNKAHDSGVKSVSGNIEVQLNSLDNHLYKREALGHELLVHVYLMVVRKVNYTHSNSDFTRLQDKVVEEIHSNWLLEPQKE